MLDKMSSPLDYAQMDAVRQEQVSEFIQVLGYIVWQAIF